MNDFVAERIDEAPREDPYDFKAKLKAQTELKAVRRLVERDFKRAVKRNKEMGFHLTPKPRQHPIPSTKK